MPRAVCLIRDREPYPHPQFAEGLRRLGYKVSFAPDHNPSRDDVLLIWNRSGTRHYAAQAFERAGAAVIVAENGWIGRTGDNRKLYALCLGHHNGAGTWPVGDTDRWPLMNVSLAPWRQRGDRVVVLASRGIGEPGIAQPRDWLPRTVADLAKRTGRRIVSRPHPGDSHAPVEDALDGAHCVVTWASGAAVKAIAAGIPAFHAMPGWIGAAAARPLGHDLEDPFLGDRLPMFRRLAWAQWSAAEISTGEPIRWLLTRP